MLVPATGPDAWRLAARHCLRFGPMAKVKMTFTVLGRGQETASAAVHVARRSLNAHAATPVDRRAERVHLFLVATLYCGASGNPVRVRNLSATGALVEGTSLPAAGTVVILRRGALEAPGSVVWSGSGKAGVAFTGLVEVAQWLPAKEAKRQTQVDRIAFGINQARPLVAGAAPLAAITVPSVEVPSVEAPTTAAMADELAAVQAQIGQLGERLAADATVLATYPELRWLGEATQRIGRVVAVLRTKPPR